MNLDDEDRAWADRWDRRLDDMGFGSNEPVPDDVDDVSEPAKKTWGERLKASFLTSEEMDNLQPPEPLIDKILYMDSLAWLIGEPANGKSFVAIDWAGHVSEGMSWCGYPVRQGTVVYVCPEGTAGLVLRKQAWESAAQRMSRVHFVTMAVPAATPGYWQLFIDEVKGLEPVLIIFDTQARMTVGMEENSAKDMGEWVEALEALREATHACILVVHHKKRGGTNMRGSTALEGAANTVINAKRDDRIIELSAEAEDGGKTKDVEPFPKITMRMVPTAGSVVLAEVLPGERVAASRPGDLELWWRLYRDTPVSGRDLFEGPDRDGQSKVFDSKKAMLEAIHRLVDEGKVQVSGKGPATRYTLRHRP